MKNLKQISKKASEYIRMSGYDLNKVRKAMKSNSFAFQVCENKQEMDDNGCDYDYPYVIWDPLNLDIKTGYSDIVDKIDSYLDGIRELNFDDGDKLTEYLDSLFDSADINSLDHLGDSEVEKDSVGNYLFKGRLADCSDYEFTTAGTDVFEKLFNACSEYGSHNQDMDKIAVISGMKHTYRSDEGDRFYWL